MNPLKDRPALYVLCISRAGYTDGARLIEFIEEYRRCVEAVGRDPGIREFSEWSRRCGGRTAYRRWKLFRDTFPELGAEGTPGDLMRPLLERLAREVEDADAP